MGRTCGWVSKRIAAARENLIIFRYEIKDTVHSELVEIDDYRYITNGVPICEWHSRRMRLRAMDAAIARTV